jgi:hypothetical protein
MYANLPFLSRASGSARSINLVREENQLAFTCCLLPCGLAPRGQTPKLRYPFWEHLSMISAIMPEGKLFTMTQTAAFDGIIQVFIRQVYADVYV